ncbi:hypothetical protein [Actinomadura rupiterrae]|uniref:hypothetical protein n=1 Tax=Actinomadura rupiterrae TaxID=559627 RepID=UPI0020A247EE|nr:hypothetical protein [Actinomadura rupiterrae]MCP2336817.1 hypothetical protein [Actinomadura rupiterrae]
MYSPRAYEEGVARGEAKSLAKPLLTVLEARRIPVPDDVAEEIANCPDADTMLAWLRRAALATHIADVFRV